MPTPFEAGKTAKELGIDTLRKFVVVRDGGGLAKNGDVLTLAVDDNTPAPKFKNDTHPIGFFYFHWYKLAYADEPEPYQPRVGDRVSFHGILVHPDYPGWRIRFGEGGSLAYIPEDGMKSVKLLSRKTRKLTKEEAESLLKEKLGESVEIN